MLQKLPVNHFKWVEDISEFNEDFIKIYNGESDEGYFLKVQGLKRKIENNIIKEVRNLF